MKKPRKDKNQRRTMCLVILSYLLSASSVGAVTFDGEGANASLAKMAQTINNVQQINTTVGSFLQNVSASSTSAFQMVPSTRFSLFTLNRKERAGYRWDQTINHLCQIPWPGESIFTLPKCLH